VRLDRLIELLETALGRKAVVQRLPNQPAMCRSLARTSPKPVSASAITPA